MPVRKRTTNARFGQVSCLQKPKCDSEKLPQNIPMTYKDKLNPWCIIRPVSTVQMRIVGRFRRRVDAEGHIRILKQLMPTVPFEIMFDIASEETSNPPSDDI